LFQKASTAEISGFTGRRTKDMSLMGRPQDLDFAFPMNYDNMLFTLKGTLLPSKHSSL
jgi:hypothetical protein